MTLVGLIGLVLLSVAQWRGAAPALAAGTITGTVFQDFNGNGAQDLTATVPSVGGGSTNLAVDRGVAGVTVTAFDAAGTAVGTATSGADGSYTLNASGTGPYRIEFGPLPAGFQPGPLGVDNSSTIRFVNDGATADVDLGIHVPGEYCQNNPDLVTSCFQAGDQDGVTDVSVRSFPYSAGSEAANDIAPYKLPATHTLSVQSQATGAVWGLDYARTRDTIYAGAFFKKHAGFGPGADRAFDTADDPGAVYLINQSNGQISTVFTVPGATTNAHDTNDYIVDGFNRGWDAVGKTALGGVALADDEATLYVMSLEDRTLYALNAVTGAVVARQTVPGVPAVAGSAPSGQAPPLPLPAPLDTCAPGAIRPFAVEYWRGQLYVGLTCTAEGSTTLDTFVDANGNNRFDHINSAERNSVVDGDGNGIYNRGDARQLRAYVYRVDSSSLAFEATPFFQMGLSYPRGIANANGQPDAEWRPWIPEFDYISINELTVYYPQPWLTDLSFDGDNLLLMLRDRTGDSTGFRAPTNPNANDPLNELWDGVGVGDVLRACPNAQGQLELESNGSCGGITTTPPVAPGTPQGPGGGEYYFDDGYGISGQSVNHDEVSLGSSVHVPGHPEVVVGTFDAFPLYPPFKAFNGGFRWYNNTTGAYAKAHVVYDTPLGVNPLTFGKANGLGDLIVLCDEAPIEIGNRVWRDDNLNGIQDPNEPPIAGVIVELFEGNNPTPVATAVTDTNGNYVFSAYRTPNDSTPALQYGVPLRPNTQYTVRIRNATGVNQQQPLNGLLPTTPNTGGPTGDSRDSDGVQSGTLVEVTLTTGGVGANNHTYDFGFVAVPTAITLDSFTARQAGGGVVVSWSTSLELETWGFHLYRSATGQLGDAVRVTEGLILARGQGTGGASYSFVDTTATEGPYAYWLEEHTTSGARAVYGPVTTGQLSGEGSLKIWLPLLVR